MSDDYETIDLDPMTAGIVHLYATCHNITPDEALERIMLVGIAYDEYGEDLLLSTKNVDELNLILDTAGAIAQFQYRKPTS